jgi:hypothetical protein
MERSGKRLTGNADRFLGSSDRNGSEIADVSATSARYEAVSLSGEGDHRRSLLSPTRECAKRRHPGIGGIPVSVRDSAGGEPPNGQADMPRNVEDLREELQLEARANEFSILSLL